MILQRMYEYVSDLRVGPGEIQVDSSHGFSLQWASNQPLIPGQPLEEMIRPVRAPTIILVVYGPRSRTDVCFLLSAWKHRKPSASFLCHISFIGPVRLLGGYGYKFMSLIITEGSTWVYCTFICGMYIRDAKRTHFIGGRSWFAYVAGGLPTAVPGALSVESVQWVLIALLAGHDFASCDSV